MKSSNPYLLAEIDSMEELFGREASELEVVKHIEALTEINRLQSEENKQLAEDKAELVDALSKITKVAGDTGTGSTLGDMDEALQIIHDVAKGLLEKHKC